MACMTHRCLDCGWLDFDNEEKGPPFCPKCGSAEIRSHFDEPDYDQEDEDGDF